MDFYAGGAQTKMNSIPHLDEIIAHKRAEIARQKLSNPIEPLRIEAELAPLPRDLRAALQAPGVSLIAEVRPAAPGQGRAGDPAALARTYADNGAAAISMLTAAPGSLEDLYAARQAVTLPILRQDFIIDLYQVYESRAAGADALSLIVAALDDAALHNLYALARHLGMAVLVEVQSAADLMRATALRPRIIGINNHTGQTLDINLEPTAALRSRISSHVTVVAEGGIRTPEDVARLAALEVDAMLVGEALVTAPDGGAKVRELVETSRPTEHYPARRHKPSAFDLPF